MAYIYIALFSEKPRELSVILVSWFYKLEEWAGRRYSADGGSGFMAAISTLLLEQWGHSVKPLALQAVLYRSDLCMDSVDSQILYTETRVPGVEWTA